MELVVKNQSTKEGYVDDAGSIPESGRSSGEGHGNPLQYSFLENPMDREAWWARVHRVTKSQTCLKQLSVHLCACTHTHTHTHTVNKTCSRSGKKKKANYQSTVGLTW